MADKRGSAANKPPNKSGGKSGSSSMMPLLPLPPVPVMKPLAKSGSAEGLSQGMANMLAGGLPVIKPPMPLGGQPALKPEIKPLPKVPFSATRPTTGNETRKFKPLGGRNLLPSKITVGPGPASMPTSPFKKANGHGSGSAKPKPDEAAGAAAPTLQQLARHSANYMDAYYGHYLQGFLEAAFEEEARRLQTQSIVDRMAGKTARMVLIDRGISQITADTETMNVAASLTLIETIRTAFDNLVDFTGEETLMEVQHILASRYMHMQVEGAVKNQPLFENNELEKILNVLRTQPGDPRDDKTKILQLCKDYFGKIEKLSMATEDVISEAGQMEEATRLLLEECSLMVSARNAGIAVEKIEVIEVADEDQATSEKPAEEAVAAEQEQEQQPPQPQPQRLSNINEVSENNTILEDSSSSEKTVCEKSAGADDSAPKTNDEAPSE